MTVRTSETDPLEIATVNTPGNGRLGLTFCPGKSDASAITGAWARDLDTDINAIVDWGATTLVTLMKDYELQLLGVPNLGEEAHNLRLDWFHLPIQDVSIPSGDFERQWAIDGPELRSRLLGGQSIVLHCRGGLGRTGLVAARLLIELDEAPEEALRKVRAARTGAVETAEQEVYVRDTGWN
jgi:ADP-ribosyl-[dinitrogen reductase] hydrolase